MAKDIRFLSDDPYDIPYNAGILNDVVITAPSKYDKSYYSPWDRQWYGIGYGGKQVPIAMPTQNIVTSPEEFMKYKQARAKEDDIGGWHQLGDQIENLMWTIMPMDASNALFDTIELGGNVLRHGWHYLRHPVNTAIRDAKAIKDFAVGAYKTGKDIYDYLNYRKRFRMLNKRLAKLNTMDMTLEHGTVYQKELDKLNRDINKLRNIQGQIESEYVPGATNSVDFSKMNEGQIRTFLKKYFGDDSLYAYYNPKTKSFEDQSGKVFNPFNPSATVTTGHVSLPDPSTGAMRNFDVPVDPLLAENQRDILFRLAPDGLSSNPVSVNPTGAVPHMPEDYLNALRENIAYMESQLPGAKLFGSSATVADGQLYHATNDIDFIMTEADAMKHPQFSNWRKVNDFHYEWYHPTQGKIDVNIIKENGKGEAYNAIAHELWAQADPEGYARYMKQIAKKGQLSTDIPLPVSSKELLDNYDPVTKSIFDAFSSQKGKHVGRSFYFLNYADTEKLAKAFHGYTSYITGGHFTPNKIPLSAFSDATKNAKYIDELGLKGINKERFIHDPERMKLLFDYATYDKTFLGRGVSNSPGNILRDLTTWSLGGGGSANGIGLNTVIGGNSGHGGWGNVYGTLLSSSLPKFTENTPEAIIHALKHYDDIFKNPLSKTQVDDIVKLANKHGVPLNVPNNANLSDILDATAGMHGQAVGDFFEELTDMFGVQHIQGKWDYGQQPYASAKNNLPIAQIMPDGMDIPISVKDREANLEYLGGTNSVTTPKIRWDSPLEKLRKGVERRRGPRATGNDKGVDAKSELKRRVTDRKWERYKVVNHKQNKFVRERRIGRYDQKRVQRLRDKLYRTERIVDNIERASAIGAITAGIGTGVYAGTNYGVKRQERERKRIDEERRKEIEQNIDRKKKKALGGPIKQLSDAQYYNIMDRVANENYRDWKFETPEAAFTYAINDPTYDYLGYYSKYPNGIGNAIDHWTDEFKTVYHPTFSNESIYSGKKSKHNPKGILGGRWYKNRNSKGYFPDYTFIPSWEQVLNRYAVK